MSIDLAYIFPNILPEDTVVFPLTQLFKQVAFLRPVEDDPPEANSPLLREISEQQEESRAFISTCPVPLAGDRDRFLGLLRDIHLHPEDYAGHLGHLAACLGSAGRLVSSEENEQSIMEALLRQTGLQAERKDNAHESTHESGKGQAENTAFVVLWQARLLLKLGETVDRNQADIRRVLDKMTLQEMELFKELRKEGKEEKDEKLLMPDLPIISPEKSISSEQQGLRLKAWARLFAFSKESFVNTAFISLSSDAVEALLEQYRKKYSRTEKQTVRLLLPLYCAGKENILLRRNRFQEEADALLNAIRVYLMKPGDSVFSKENEAVWNDLLEQHYPATEYGRCILTLYFLPDVNPKALFLDTFAAQDELPEDVTAQQAAESKKGPGIVLGLLSR